MFKCAVGCSPGPFAVDNSDEIPHGDNGTTTGCCHVRKQVKVRHASQVAVVVCAWEGDGVAERPCLRNHQRGFGAKRIELCTPGSRLSRGQRSRTNQVAPWRYLHWERDKDGFATFYPVKSCTAMRDKDDTHMQRPAITKLTRSICR